jgi:hypothetical protein
MRIRLKSAGVGLGLLLVAPIAAFARQNVPWHPSVSVTQLYDSNVFSTTSNRLGDFITRLSPGIETNRRSALWTLLGRYTFDVERFAEHDELSSATARQNGTVSFEYRPTSRWAFTSGGEVVTTRTPRDLTTDTGIALVRAAARRLTAQSSLSRALSPVMSGTVEYSFADDRLGREFEADTHSAAVSAVRRLSARTAIRGAYRIRRFAFVQGAAAEPASVVGSHGFSAGWSRAISQRLDISIEAGPQIIGGVIRPEVSASLECRCEPADVTLAYARTQTTVVGFVGAADVQSFRVTAARTFGRSLRVRMTPSVLQTALAGREADVYVVGVEIAWPISSAFSFEAMFDGSLQRGSFRGALDPLVPISPFRNDDIARNSVLIRVVAAPAVRPR